MKEEDSDDGGNGRDGEGKKERSGVRGKKESGVRRKMSGVRGKIRALSEGKRRGLVSEGR